jgi:hypothetical protein
METIVKCTVKAASKKIKIMNSMAYLGLVQEL